MVIPAHLLQNIAVFKPAQRRMPTHSPKILLRGSADTLSEFFDISPVSRISGHNGNCLFLFY